MRTIREWAQHSPPHQRTAIRRFLERKFRCERCGASVLRDTEDFFSVFDLAFLCKHCNTEEATAPGYDAAKQQLHDAHQRGDWGFEGVGLTVEDKDYLNERQLARYGHRVSTH